MEIATTEPTSLRAGDTWAWTRTLADYPASAWTLTYYFRNATAKFDVVATASGDSYAVTVAKASSGKTPGWYDWTAFVESATERHQVNAGRVQILPNVAADVVNDGRTFARRMLDAIEAILEGRATSSDIDRVSVGMEDRSHVQKPELLLPLRDRYRVEVRREEMAQRAGSGSRILVRQ
jgi:hypothetical protein